MCVGRDEEALGRVADEVAGSFLAVDVGRRDSAELIVGHTASTYGRLDAVVVNAGVGYAGDFADMSTAGIAELLDVNLLSAMLLARACLQPLRDTGQLDARRCGAIVFVSSIAGAVGVPGETVYSATKAGLNIFAASLREELRPIRVSVSTVVPGVVDTGFFAARGTPYSRRFPRLMSPVRVTDAIERALDTGAAELVVPRWLVVPSRLSGAAPRLYRSLSRRFG